MAVSLKYLTLRIQTLSPAEDIRKTLHLELAQQLLEAKQRLNSTFVT
jgi:hypothetical protein